MLKMFLRSGTPNMEYKDKENKIVYISHMYYGGRNYLEGLI